MAVTVTTPSTNFNLCTLAILKDELGITTTGQDATLSRIISRASDAVASYCNRTFARQAYSETVRGYGGTKLMLTNTPVTAISSISDQGAELASTGYFIDDANAGTVFRATGWRWTAGEVFNLSAQPLPGTEAPDFTVAYTAGYVLPGSTGSTQTLPGDIEEAALLTAKVIYKNRSRDDSVKSKEVRDTKLVFEDQDKRFRVPASARELLREYRRSV